MLRVPSTVNTPSTITLIFTNPTFGPDLTNVTGVTLNVTRQDLTTAVWGCTIVSATAQEIVVQYTFTGTGEITGTGVYYLAPVFTLSSGTVTGTAVAMYVMPPNALNAQTEDSGWIAVTAPVNFGAAVLANAHVFAAKSINCAANRNIAACSVTSDEGVVSVKDDIVFLANQTDATQNGLWKFGTVTSGTAPLTRPYNWILGATIPAGSEVLVTNGTFFGGSKWRHFSNPTVCAATADVVVGTTSAAFYPQRMCGIATLTGGSATATFIPFPNWAHNTDTGTDIKVHRRTGANCALSVRYEISAATPGQAGTCSFTMRAELASGALNSADTSTVTWEMVNY